MSQPQPNHPISRMYRLLAEDDDGRACKDIPDSTCTALPRNFFLLLLGQSATSLADLLSNPKTVLSWLLAALGTPAGFLAWLVPVRESGAMLPQLLIGAWVRRFAVRKYFLLLGSGVQAASLAAMALCAVTLQGDAAGFAIILLLLLFSLARGLNSVAMKDVVGKTIPKGRRGRLSGLAASISGVLTALVALWLLPQQNSDAALYALLLLGAAGLWLTAAGLFSCLREHPGASEGGVNAFAAARKNLQLIVTDSVLRRFIFCRALLLSSALAQPFVVLLAQQQHSGGQMLALLLLASSIAGAVSAPIWGRLADSNSRRVLWLAALAAAAACALCALSASQAISGQWWFYPLLFTWLNIAHAGVRLGRKTYLLDIASGNRRTDYVSVSNSLIGATLLLAGAIGAVIASFSISAVLWFFALCSLFGALLALRLKAVSD
jgi:MFS family permease